MNLKTAEAWRLSEAALAFANKYVEDPVMKRNITYAVWQTRGYNVIAGAPVPIGENATAKMGRPNEEWQQPYIDAYSAAVEALLDEENAEEQQKQHEAQQRAEEEYYARTETEADS